MFKWLINLFFRRKPKPEASDPSKGPDVPFVPPCDLSGDIARVRRERESITDPRTDWMTVQTHEAKTVPSANEFTPPDAHTVQSLSDRKRRRIEEEKLLAAKRLNSAQYLSDKIASAIVREDLENAKSLLSNLLDIANAAGSEKIWALHTESKSKVESLSDLLYQRRIEREQEEHRQVEEAKKREAEEKELQRKEAARLAAEEKKRKEEAAARALQLQREKEDRDRKEKARIEALKYKDAKDEILQYLRANGIRWFYHFTDESNLQSIREHGGLYSWSYCEEHNILIPYPGGDYTSRQLDIRHGLEDYVRLSFCNDHPMAYRLVQEGRRLVLLRIKVEVAILRNTQFSDINAADSAHSHGPRFSDLKKVNMDAVKANFVSRGREYFKPHQAEVLVKTHIPLDLIDNLDSPYYIN